MYSSEEVSIGLGDKGRRGSRFVGSKGFYRGTSLIRNRHPPSDHHMALGISLL